MKEVQFSRVCPEIIELGQNLFMFQFIPLLITAGYPRIALILIILAALASLPIHFDLHLSFGGDNTTTAATPGHLHTPRLPKLAGSKKTGGGGS